MRTKVGQLLAKFISRPKPAQVQTGIEPNHGGSHAEPIEPRLLYSADLAPLGSIEPAIPTPTLQAQRLTSIVDQRESIELVVLDAKVADAFALIADITTQKQNGRTIEVLHVGNEEDGVKAVSDRLAELAKQGYSVSAIHIISHGSDGEFELGNQRVDDALLRRSAPSLSAWADVLTEQADILVYGCNFADSEKGTSFAKNLAAITGADIAGNSDDTGDLALGGDWLLDFSTGAIDASVAFSANVQGQWHHLLALETIGSPSLVNANTSGSQSTGLSVDTTTAGAESTGGDKIAVDAAGNYVVVWVDSGTAKIRFFNANNTPKTPGDGVLPKVTSPGEFQRQVAVAMNASGETVAVWSEGAGTTSSIYAMRISSTGFASSPLLVRSGDAAMKPAVAINDAGEFVIAWQENIAGEGVNILASAYSGASALLSEAVLLNSDPGNSDRTRPTVAISNSTAVVAWRDASNGMIVFRIITVFNNNAYYGVETQANANSNNVANETAPDVAINDSGKIVITWEGLENGALHTYYSVFQTPASQATPPTLVVPETRVNLTTANAQSLPKVAIADIGEFVIVQQGASQTPDYDGFGIFARSFAGNNTPTNNTETAVNFFNPDPAFTTSGQTAPAIAWRGGKIVTAWTSYQNLNNDVFARQLQLTSAHTFVVNTAADIVDPNDGLTSLREAIIAANSTANQGLTPDTIFFGIANGQDHQLILTTGLPAIVDAVVIDGVSQAFFNGGTITIVDQSNAIAALHLTRDQIDSISSSGSTITGLSIRSLSGTGIKIESSQNKIISNTILQSQVGGIVISGLTFSDTSLNEIDTNTVDRNNGIGISIVNSSGNKILNNIVSQNYGNGVALNSVGAGQLSKNNLIAGNTIGANFNGIQLTGEGTTNNKIVSNRIGVDSLGNSIANLINGISINLGSASNAIGSDTVGAQNTIAFNGAFGIDVAPSSSGTPSNNFILRNSLYANLGDGINVAAQEMINAPSLYAVTEDGVSTYVAFQYQGAPNSYYRLEFFYSVPDGTDGFGVAKTFLGSINIQTNSAGLFETRATLSAAAPVGSKVTATATATDPSYSQFGSTSNISYPFSVGMWRTVAENQAPQTYNVAPYLHDPAQTGLVYTLLTSSDSSHFSLTPAGQLSFNLPINYEAVRNDVNGGGDDFRWAYVSISNGTYYENVAHVFKFIDANDAPVVTVGQPVTVTQGSAIGFTAGTITVSDPDTGALALSTPLTLTVSTEIVGVPGQSSGLVSIGGISGISRTVTGTIAELNAYLNGVLVATDPGDPRSIRVLFSLDDGGSGFGIGEKLVTPASLLINITPLANVPPVISGLAASASYTENSGVSYPLGSIVLTNSDGPTLSSATITYTSSLLGTEEALTFPDATLLGLTLNHNTSTNTITISGIRSTADYQTFIRNIQYENISNSPRPLNRRFDISIDDGIDQSGVASTTITTLLVNDAPYISFGASTGYTIGYNMQLNFNAGLMQALDFGDPDFTAGMFSLVISVPTSPSAGIFTYSAASMSAITGGGLTVNGSPFGDNTVLLSGVKALITQAVGLLTYSPALGHTGNEIITFSLNDGGNFGSGGSRMANATVTVTTSTIPNTPPTVSGIATNQTFIENGSAVAIFNGINITDTQQTNIAAARITTGGAFDPLQDQQPKFISRPGGILATRTGNELLLYGNLPISDYISALNTLLFINTSDSPSTAARTFSLEVFDGTSWSTPVTTSITVTPVDDPLVLGLPTTGVVNFGQTFVLTGTSSELYLTDLDAGTTVYEMTVRAVQGFASIDGARPAPEVSVRGTIGALNTLLQTQRITYTPNAGFAGVDELSVTILEIDPITGNLLPLKLASSQVQLTVLAGMPPELLGGESKAYFTEDTGRVTLHGGLKITGGNNSTLEFASVQIVGGYDSATDTLIATKIPTGIVAKWDASSGTLTLTGSASIANYELALASVAYDNNSQNPSDTVRQISMFALDSLQQSNELLIEVVVQPVNDSPTLVTPSNLSTAEDSGLVFSLANAIKANDIDSDQLVLSISVSNGELRWLGASGPQVGIRIVNSSSVELSGNASEINQFAAQFEFIAPPNFNGIGNVQWSLMDSQGASVNKSSVLQVTPINDTPTWRGLGGLAVEQGKSAIISTTQTLAQDVEDNADQLAYVLSVLPSNGSLEKNGVSLNLGASFNQADIDSGAIAYKHNNTASSFDSFSFSVRDSGGASTTNHTVAIAISLAPVIVITPSGSGGNTGVGTTTPPPITTTVPVSTVETKSSGGTDVIDQPPSTASSAPNSASSGQSKAVVRSPASTSSAGSAITQNDSSNLSTQSNTSSQFGNAAESAATQIARAGFSASIKSNTDDAPRGEQSLGASLLKVRSIAENTEYAAILRSAMGNQAFNDDVQKVRSDAQGKLKFSQNVVASTTAVSATLSIGYVIWLVRGGALLSSLLASIPAWSLVDPLPVLGSMGSNEEDSDDESLEEMIKKSRASRIKAAELAAYQPELQA
jgi:CSLREA domain-containing protein